VFSRFIKEEHLKKTHSFFNKYGSKTLIIARFVPIVRTIAPFVAGVGRMNYLKFVIFSLVGSFLWVFLLILAGFFFGNIPFVERNLSLVIILIIFLSFIPAIIEYFRNKHN
jgi:membrane-associated protein